MTSGVTDKIGPKYYFGKIDAERICPKQGTNVMRSGRQDEGGASLFILQAEKAVEVAAEEIAEDDGKIVKGER